MIINYLTQAGNKKYFRSLIKLMIIIFTVTTCGCYSSEKVIVKPENLRQGVNYEITKAIMKDGLVVNLENTEATYASKYQGLYNVIVYKKIDTIQVQAGRYNMSSTLKFLELKDIQSLVIERDEINTGLTIVATIAIVAIVVGAIILIANSSSNEPKPTNTSRSCPFIYSYDGKKYIFDGEPYGGSTTEGLKRTDYSRLEELKASDGKYKLLMRNESDETQFTDEVKLLVVDHQINTEVAPDKNGNMTVFKKAFPPLSVTDENGSDITTFFKVRDNVQWQTDMPEEKDYDFKKQRHELILKFPKPENAKRVKLLINTGTAFWGEYMIKSMLEHRGNKVDDWYRDVNNKGVELFKLYQLVEREELYLLKTNILENDKWVNRGFITAGGPYIDEDRILDLNIENVSGDTLYIKLNPPYGFWKFDYAGVIYDAEVPVKVTELSLTYAKNEQGTNLLDSLSGIDRKYYSMPYLTNYADLEFDVPKQMENTNRSLFLKTTGYYEIHLKKDQPEQTELIERVYNTPGLILELSMKEYFEKAKKFTSTEGF